MHDGIATLSDFVVENIGNTSTHPLTSIVVVHFNNPPPFPRPLGPPIFSCVLQSSNLSPLFFCALQSFDNKGTIDDNKNSRNVQAPMMVITPRSTKRSMELEASSSHLSTCIACPYNG